MPGPAVQVVVDATHEHQKMLGFGAATLSLRFDADDNVAPALRPLALAAAYQQVGLSLGNLDIEPFESPTTALYMPANDDGDPTTTGMFNWTQSTNMVDGVVTTAAQTGFSHFWLGPVVRNPFELRWTIPIRDVNYSRYLDEVAEHVTTLAKHWRDTYDIVPPYLQLFDEPLTGKQTLLNGTTPELVDIIKRAGARLRIDGFTTMKFIIPAEASEQASLTEAQAILLDPDARQYVGAIGYHAYSAGSTYSAVPNILAASGAGTPDQTAITVRNALRDLGAQYNVPTMMLEVSKAGLPVDSADNLRGRAIHIHDELVYADAAAFCGQYAMWDSTTHSQTYAGQPNPGFYNQTDSIVLVDNQLQKVTITPMGRAIGHYARWLHAGDPRIDASSDDPLVQVVAFNDQQARIVVVAINNDTTTRTVHISAIGTPGFASVEGELSTGMAASEVWQPITALPSGQGWDLELPPHSVATTAARFGGLRDDYVPPDGDVDGTTDGGMTDTGGGGGCCDAGGSAPASSFVLGLAALAVLRRRAVARRA